MLVSARPLRSVLRLSALLMLSAAAAGCSSAPDWVDPTTWMGSSSEPPTTPAGDQTASASTDPSAGQTVAEANDQYPALADQPDKAPPGTSTDEQKQVADGLTADRSQAQYSGDALRGGADAAAAPPSPAPPPAPPPTTTEAETPAATSAEPPAATPVSTDTDSGTIDANPDRDAGDLPTGKAPMPGALPAIQSNGQAASAAPVTAQTAPPPAAVATAPMPAPAPSTAAPASPPAPAFSRAAMAPPPAQPVSQSDAALGFQPSHAPPLDASVSQFVAPAVLDRYQQTAAMSSAAGIAGEPRAHARSAHRHVRHHKKAAVAAAPQ